MKMASSNGLPLPAPVIADRHRPAVIGWREASALAHVVDFLIVHRLPMAAPIAMFSGHIDTCLMDKSKSIGQSYEMRDWRTPEQELQDKRSRRGLMLDAWSISLAMAVLLLVMARELSRW